VTLLEKYFIDPPLKNVFFILRGIYRERKKIIMKKVIRLTESEFISLVKKVINESKNGNVNEQMSTMASNALKTASTQGGGVNDPSWLKYASNIVGSTIDPFNQGAALVSSVTAMAKNPGEDKMIIIPKGTTFKLTPSRNFMIAKAYQINPKQGVFDNIRALKDNQYIANMLKSGQLNATPIDIAVVKGLGGILYPNGMSALSLSNPASQPLQRQIMAL
jgi:hypothetical protein